MHTKLEKTNHNYLRPPNRKHKTKNIRLKSIKNQKKWRNKSREILFDRLHSTSA